MQDWDEGKNIFKIDGPIGRLDFFWITLGILIVTLPIVLFKELFILIFPIAIILLLAIIWISFVSLAKRMWDITGQFKQGLIIAIVLTVIQWIFSIFGLVILIVCLAVPGKLINSKKETE